ncbi:N-acetylmuramoyl-L-alanine amidase [Tissierella praeacuta]|uniref:peptidoglycan recognition protein family protein n=1 Tax=Tissierella praeacuta TaxID=43131 RepID=UPI0033425A8D
MNYKVQHITNKNKLINIPMKPECLTIHSTANEKSTAQNERDNLNRENNITSTGFHMVVDDKETIECIPFNMVAYHAGDGVKGVGNTKSIGLEICESGDRAKTLQNAVEVVAKILYERGWGIDRLKRHHDWSGKNCPRILSANNWEGWTAFKLQVERKLNDMNDKGLDKIKIVLHGKELDVEGIYKDKTNYIPVKLLERLGYNVTGQGTNIVIEYKGEDK